MGMWDEMCVVCGGALCAPDEEDLLYEDQPEAEATFLRAQSLEGVEWLDDKIGITEKGERLTLGHYGGYGYFDLDDAHSSFSLAAIARYQTSWSQGEFYGLVCHRKCYELLERDLQYSLRFSDVWPMLMQQEYGSWLHSTDYGGMATYMEQGFMYGMLYLEGNGWMLQDPTTNKRNGDRILKLWQSIIQSGFQVQAPSGGEPDGSQAGHEEAASETAMDSVAGPVVSTESTLVA